MNLPQFLVRLLFGCRFPVRSGAIQVTGVTKPVLIRRDRYGIPCIEAETDPDAWFGLGFCHGQDRAFQLEGLLRVVRGTLAELVGIEALPVDRLSRRIGFRIAALRQLEVLEPGIRSMLEAYARGVTEGATKGCPRPAHEFALLRASPTSYEAADSLGVLKLMSFNLASNWDSELARLKILQLDGPEALAALDLIYPEWLPVPAPPGALGGKALDRLAEDLALFRATLGPGGGSNNWVIAPTRTATGRPLLANDPHLAAVLPPYWYLAHLRMPDWEVAGASFVGAPGFPVGFNGLVAWGNTAGLLDNTDLFLEEVGADGRSVRQGNDFVPCEVRREVIHVKGGRTVEEEVLVTPRGPIIGPVLLGEVGAVSLRATWLDARPLRGLLQLHRVRSWSEFREAGSQWPALPLNLVYADTSGVIGWQLIGEAPQRRKGWGTLPLPGWHPEVGWREERVPFAEMPHAVNPSTGFIATANTRPAPEGTGPFLGVDWVDGYRLARILEVLGSRNDWDLDGAQALQMDQASLPWREIRERVLAMPNETEETRQAIALLRDWDGVLAAGSAAAALFEFFLAEMLQRIAKTKAPKAAQWALGKGFSPLAGHSILAVRRTGHLVRLIREQPDGWFNRPWPQVMAEALAAALEKLRGRSAPEPARWSWGQVRTLTLRHPFGKQGLLSGVFNLGPFPWGGDANTVGQAANDPIEPASGALFIASLRMVVDVGNWDENRFALPGGQSGNPLSPQYADLLPFWQRGEGVAIAWSPTKVEETTCSILRLVPK